MCSAHCLARLLRSSIAAIGKSRSLGVRGKTNWPRLKFSHSGRSIGWMFSHARFNSFLCSISLITKISISGFLVKSSYLFILSAQRSKAASSLSPKATKLFSTHSPKAIRWLTTFSIRSFSLSITFNMRILNHRSARKSRINCTFFSFFYVVMRHSLKARGPLTWRHVK